MMVDSRLKFEKHEDVYRVKDSFSVELCWIARVRNGQWMHWSMMVTPKIMKECLDVNECLTFSPGCQDEIREFCKKLNSRKMKKNEN